MLTEKNDQHNYLKNNLGSPLRVQWRNAKQPQKTTKQTIAPIELKYHSLICHHYVGQHNLTTLVESSSYCQVTIDPKNNTFIVTTYRGV